MADRDNKCKHHGCSCAASGDSEYCSAACETMGDQDITEIACNCGHSGCAGEIDQ